MKVLVTAGPTREFIDPVRFLTNRSTGKMGYAIAEAFREKGHEVVLISGPVNLEAPEGVRVIQVVSASQMHESVTREFTDSDALIMAAAVADWSPAEVHSSKLKKGGGGDRLLLELIRTVDILKVLSRCKRDQIMAGFAAETGAPVAEGRRKLQEKGLDIIFCNDVTGAGAGFECETNRIVCIESSGSCDEWPLISKKEAGQKIAKLVEDLYINRQNNA